MGETGRLPRINEVAAYLDQYAPRARAQLLENSPHLGDLLKPGTCAGDGDAESTLMGPLRDRATIVSEALLEALGQADQDAALIHNKLGRLRKTRFFAQICGAIGSCGVLATVLSSPIAALVAGALALASTLAGLAADTMILGGAGNEEKLREILSSLAKTSGQGRLTQKILAGFGNERADFEEIKLVLSEANALFAELIKVRADIASLS